VGTGIKEHPHLTIFTADKEKRPASYRTALVVSGLLHFRLVPQVDPASVKDLLLFPPEQIHGGHGRSVDPENTPLPVVYDQILDLHK
jgi:hypothetical protein